VVLVNIFFTFVVMVNREAQYLLCEFLLSDRLTEYFFPAVVTYNLFERHMQLLVCLEHGFSLTCQVDLQVVQRQLVVYVRVFVSDALDCLFDLLFADSFLQPVVDLNPCEGVEIHPRYLGPDVSFRQVLHFVAHVLALQL